MVSELRRLDQRTTPTEALHDMLTLLARRLRLSYASIEVYASSPEGQIETSVGASRGHPTAIVLEVGGATLGLLQLEVTASRESLGRGTAVCSRTSGDRWAPWSRRSRPTVSCNDLVNDW